MSRWGPPPPPRHSQVRGHRYRFGPFGEGGTKFRVVQGQAKQCPQNRHSACPVPETNILGGSAGGPNRPQSEGQGRQQPPSAHRTSEGPLAVVHGEGCQTQSEAPPPRRGPGTVGPVGASLASLARVWPRSGRVNPPWHAWAQTQHWWAPPLGDANPRAWGAGQSKSRTEAVTFLLVVECSRCGERGGVLNWERGNHPRVAAGTEDPYFAPDMFSTKAGMGSRAD